MAELLVPLTPDVIRREIDRFARLLIEGRIMPLCLIGVDTQTMTVQTIASPLFLDRLRASEAMQEKSVTDFRNSLGRLVAGPIGRGSG